MTTITVTTTARKQRYLHEGEDKHEDEVTDPVEGQRQAHGGGSRLLAENFTDHDERYGT